MSWFSRKSDDVSAEFRTLRLCLRFLVQNPAVVLPLAGAWILSVGILFHFIPRIPWRRLDPSAALFYVWALAAAVNYVTLFACSMLLEFLQHIETGRPTRMFRAFFDTLVRNSWALLPLAAVWAVVEVVLWIVESLLASKDRSSDRVLRTFFDILHKGIRLGVFLSLPAIAWEGAGPWKAVRRSVDILKGEWVSFLGAMSLSALFVAIVALPMTIGWLAAPEWMKAHLSWVIGAAAVLWTLKIYLEQMMMAELYLWARCAAWDEFRRLGDPLRRAAPETEIVPSLFNGIPDLKERMGIAP
ncbi:MAG TPA: hypothetical protein VF950_05075 [Planctomycetota bacterium]